MNFVDYAILGIAAYVAVMSLVRLMRQRQRQVMQELAGEVRRQKALPRPKLDSAAEDAPPPPQQQAA